MRLTVADTRGWIFFGSGLAAMLAIGWIVFPALLYKSEPQPINFSHKIHAGDQVGLACQDCHSMSSDGRYLGLPRIAKCAECHSAQIGQNENEKRLVEEFVTPNKEIPWLVYSRQPDNAYFSHASHVVYGKMKCETCHDSIGTSDSLRSLHTDRISGYSRTLAGSSVLEYPFHSIEGMKMDRCIDCHAQRGRRDGCIECHK